MTKDKELLFKDLSARLPYHPRIRIYNDSWEGCRIGVSDYPLGCHHIEAFLYDIIEIVPYLRPLSSMTKEEKEYVEDLSEFYCTPDVARDKIDFYLEHHLDFRGLIPKGFAFEAPKDMYEINRL